MTGWTDGPQVATCAECATRFAGMVCPNCRQRLEAFEVDQIAMVCGDGSLVVLAERTPDPALEAVFDGPEVA